MTTVASQITSLTVVYSTVYSDADQRKHQSSASLAFVWGIHRDRWILRTKGQLRGNVSIWWRHHEYCCICVHCQWRVIFQLYHQYLDPSQNIDGLSRYGIFIIKIQRSSDRLIFIMGLPILVRRHVYIEMGPHKSIRMCHHLDPLFHLRYILRLGIQMSNILLLGITFSFWATLLGWNLCDYHHASLDIRVMIGHAFVAFLKHFWVRAFKSSPDTTWSKSRVFPKLNICIFLNLLSTNWLNRTRVGVNSIFSILFQFQFRYFQFQFQFHYS